MSIARVELQGPFVVDGGQFSFSAIGNVLITSQNGDLTVNAMKRANELHASVLARYPGGTCMLSHLRVMKVPSPDVRKAISEAMARYDATTLRRAIVMSEGGFVASIVRSVLAGITTLDGLSAIQKYFGDLPDATRYLAEVAQPTTVSADTILRAAHATIEAQNGSPRAGG